jgi:hypothetical protein
MRRSSGPLRDRVAAFGVLTVAIAFSIGWLTGRRCQRSINVDIVTRQALAETNLPSFPPEVATSPLRHSRRRAHKVPWPLSLFATLWFWLTFVGLLLADLGFALLPPDQTAINTYRAVPHLTLWVDQPDVNILAVLDASSTDNLPNFSILQLYADTQKSFSWIVKTSKPRSIQEARGPWVDTVQDHVAADSLLALQQHGYSVMEGEITAGRFHSAAAIAVGYVFLRSDPDFFARSGAHIVLTPPVLSFGLEPGPSDTSVRAWYRPHGEVVILAPSIVQYNRTDIAGPPFAGPGVWRDPYAIFPFWSGTDVGAEAYEQRNLFIAGLAFGIAGSALIAAVQELSARISERRNRRAAGT